MNACCHPHHPFRPRFFNWITIALLTAWIGLVAVALEHSGDAAARARMQVAVEQLTAQQPPMTLQSRN